MTVGQHRRLEQLRHPSVLTCLLMSHSFNRYFRGTYSVPATLVEAGNLAVHTTDLCPHGRHSVGEDKGVRKINENVNSM